MIDSSKYPFTIALDMVEKRAACVILQGMYSTTAPTEATTQLYGNDGWLVAPNENIRVYEVDSPETFEKLINHFTQ
jgi:hypothetical protein